MCINLCGEGEMMKVLRKTEGREKKTERTEKRQISRELTQDDNPGDFEDFKS
jgi:hypothetical protein